MIAPSDILPEGYWVEGSMLWSSERRRVVFSKKQRELRGWRDTPESEDLGPRPVCSWNGDGIPADLLVHVARLDKASRHGSPAVRRDALLELASIFRG